MVKTIKQQPTCPPDLAIEEIKEIAGLRTGDVVYIVGADQQIRPAVVTRIHSEAGMVNLYVFLDHSHFDFNEKSVLHSVHYSAEKLPHTWHLRG